MYLVLYTLGIYGGEPLKKHAIFEDKKEALAKLDEASKECEYHKWDKEALPEFFERADPNPTLSLPSP